MSSVLYPEPVGEVTPGSRNSVNRIDPLRDPRWSRLVSRHPQASLFHSVEWLAALKDTYGYEPRAYTTAARGEELENGLLFSSVKSWVTGSRLVSAPFSDHCDPMLANDGDAGTVCCASGRGGSFRQIGLRGVAAADPI
jgi:hypothetical protein